MRRIKASHLFILTITVVMLLSFAACDGADESEQTDAVAISDVAYDILEDYGCLLEFGSKDLSEATIQVANVSTSGIASKPTRSESREALIEGPYQVVRVVDGDTMVLDINGVEEKVRLIGVDTPESVHPDESRNVEYGKVASEYSKSMLEGQKVYVEYDVQERDRYGRILAYVYLGERMYNQVLLAEGHAKVATYPPNVRYVDDFTAIQQAARENGVGLWAIEGTDEQLAVSGATSGVLGTDAALSGDTCFIGNKNSKVFHQAGCPSVGRMKESNKVEYATREAAIEAGYEPCANCNP